MSNIGSGISWGYGEVVNTDNCFNQTTNAEKNKKRSAEGKAEPGDKADPKYRGEIEVNMHGVQGGIPGGASGDVVVAYPADWNYTRIPLVGEHVVMYKGPGPNQGTRPPAKTGEKSVGLNFDQNWYYLPPMTIRGNIEANMNPGSNTGGVAGDGQTVADGEVKTKTDAYTDAEQGNPSTSNKMPDLGGNEGTINYFPDYSKGELDPKDIAEFQELEQLIIDLENPEGELRLRIEFELENGKNIQSVEDRIEEAKQEIEEHKEYLKDEKGFIGEFIETKNPNGVDTITGYLPDGNRQSEEKKKQEEQQKQNEIAGRDPNTGKLNTTNEDGGPGQNTLQTPPGHEYVEKGNIGNLQPYEGDVLIQGRMGQSIRLGSQFTPKDPDRYSIDQELNWTAGDAPEGSPINIFRCGEAMPGQGGGTTNNFILEDVNGDKTSIYMTSGQKIPINVVSEVYDACNAPIRNSSDRTYYDSNGNPIPSNDCNSVSSPINVQPEPKPMPENCNELKEIPGEWEMFKRGKPTGFGKLRMVGAWPMIEKYACLALQMILQARKDGIRIQVNSGYRGIYQVNHPDTGNKLASGQLNCRYNMAINRSWATEANKKDRSSPLWTAPSTAFKPYVAIPGYSRHQSGTAIDLDYKRHRWKKGSKGGTEKSLPDGKWYKTVPGDKDGTYAWLVANAPKFGFIRTVKSEEWHFEYDPSRAAKGPFAKVPSGHSSWHGLDRHYLAGTLGPHGNNKWTEDTSWLRGEEGFVPDEVENFVGNVGDNIVSLFDND